METVESPKMQRLVYLFLVLRVSKMMVWFNVLAPARESMGGGGV